MVSNYMHAYLNALFDCFTAYSQLSILCTPYVTSSVQLIDRRSLL